MNRLPRTLGRSVKHCGIAMLLGTVCAAGLVGSASANTAVEREIFRNALENILRDVRDQIQRRTLAPLPSGRMQFIGEATNVAARVEEPFAALGYSALVRKAAPMVAAPPPAYIIGANLNGAVDRSFTAGTVTNSASITGAGDITKIGVFQTTDALSVILTGSGIFSRIPGVVTTNTATSVGAGTIAYVNGGFSTDFTVNGMWTRTQLTGAGIVAAAPNTSAASYTPNAQYKFEAGNGVFYEPTVGLTYTETYTANIGKTGDNTELHGGVRVGWQTMWDSVRVQPTVAISAYTFVGATGIAAAPGTAGIPLGQIGLRASAKVSFIVTDKFQGFVEAHGNSIVNTSAYGAMGGMRWTF
jgi:hypothetical protein